MLYSCLVLNNKGLGIISTICSSMDMYWRFTTPFCTMSQMIHNILFYGYVLELHFSLLYHVLYDL
jgi:hypothetical protein